MTKNYDYNIVKYLDTIMGVETMMLDAIFNRKEPCKYYTLSPEVSDYLSYIEKEPFYISPNFDIVKTDQRLSTLDPKIILFSAPGATGKSSLAKYIAYKYNAIYWDLAKIKLGTNSFVGSILNAVSAENYSKFISDLNDSGVMLVIDAFDEAEVVSGRKMIGSFISEINTNLSSAKTPSVILLARTETAQFLASLCADNGIALAHYEIGFFAEMQAKDFIRKRIINLNTETKKGNGSKEDAYCSPSVIQCIDSYYSVIKNSITPDEAKSFLGYAPVLEAIATQIFETPNPAKLISALDNKTGCASIIMQIMDSLLDREQEKLCTAFQKKCEETHPEFSDWNSLYCKKEQLVRLMNYIIFNDTSYANFEVKTLPPQLVDDYAEILNTFLTQHPFVRSNPEWTSFDESHFDYTGPAFRDYVLAKMILEKETESYAHIYFEEKNRKHYFPSQIFFDCYTNITNGYVNSAHISYVYDSYRAKATAMERPYLQCSETLDLEFKNMTGVATFGMSSKMHPREETVLDVEITGNELTFDQPSHIVIDVPDLNVRIGTLGGSSQITSSSIVCKKIVFAASNISIEAYPPEECLIVSREPIEGEVPVIDTTHAKNLHVSAPNIHMFYRLIPYSYNFDDTKNLDILKFTHALRCIMVEFRAHKKDTLAKDAERIDNVVVGKNPLKHSILDYLKSRGVVYYLAPLYKIDTAKMQEIGISYAGLARMDLEQMRSAYMDYTQWARNIAE